MAKPFRVGMIGSRPSLSQAKESHVPAVRTLAGRELVAVAGCSPEKAAVAAKGFGADRTAG